MVKRHVDRRWPTAVAAGAGLALAVVIAWPQAARAEYPPKGDFARGARLWVLNCGRCHDARDPKELRDDQWITTLYHMRVRGGLTGQDVRDLYTFMERSN